ncbi:hypothetical protein DLJ61_01440 [Gordonia terrae]|jgi:hypothetical protein|uniref:Uncharacterized protein n=1 Tax=Gordonia terrae TaxID=2055 RepID=A0AAD0NXW8_9ACTN|nr:hypothetical protein BCM27_01430 [Gordonia terrae]AWO82389.1 hypothetical protein DLJ61_01440 [Gordonia terrae]VTR08932.1 Uncharacterised protein [Clostridioides difficile]
MRSGHPGARSVNDAAPSLKIGCFDAGSSILSFTVPHDDTTPMSFRGVPTDTRSHSFGGL